MEIRRCTLSENKKKIKEANILFDTVAQWEWYFWLILRGKWEKGKKSRRYQPESESLAAFCAFRESLFRTPVGVASGALVVVTSAMISMSVLEASADCPVGWDEAPPVKLAGSSAGTWNRVGGSRRAQLLNCLFKAVCDARNELRITERREMNVVTA